MSSYIIQITTIEQAKYKGRFAHVPNSKPTN